MAAVTSFTVIQGKPIEFSITIKENATITPLVLDPSDTFVFSIMNKRTNEKYVDSKAMTIIDALNGEVSGSLTDIETGLLPVKKSAPEDGFIARSNLRLVIHGDTAAQGQMSAVIENVYVVNG